MKKNYKEAVVETLKEFNQLEYIKQFDKENYKHYHIKVNVNDADVIEKLNQVESKNGYIVDLIKKDIGGKTMKDLRDIKSEYGYVLRWINGGGDEDGNTYPYQFYLEDVDTKERIKIDNQDAIDFISEVTLPSFKRKWDQYDNYVKLFNILGIKKR